MSRSAIDRAKSLLKRRKFSLAITLLQSYREFYADDFEFNLLMGHSYLYSGDFGTASSYYKRARSIKINDSELILGQAAIFLQRGDTKRAITYYLDVLEIDPENKIARAALDFIRDFGEYPIIVRWYETGKLQRFFPSLGINPSLIIKSTVIGAFSGLIIASGILLFSSINNKELNISGPRKDLTSMGLALTSSERDEALEKDLSGSLVNFMLTNKEATDIYDKAVSYFQEERDNACLVEINRLLQSNVSSQLKNKAKLLKELLFPSLPTFDNLSDNVSYSQVFSSKVPELYDGCYVAWNGRISKAQLHEDGSWSCTLLVGYENLDNFEGFVNVIFPKGLSPVPDGKKAVRFLARISFVKGSLQLEGISVYQPLKDGVLKN